MYVFKEERHTVLEDRVARIEERVGRIEEHVTKIEERTIKIEERAGKIEERVTKIECDVGFLRADALETRQDLKGLANRFGVFEVEVAKRFGAVDASIESVRTSVEQSKRWVIVTGVSAVVSLVGFLGTLVAIGHAMKWF